MSAIIIDGKNAAKEIRRQIKQDTEQLIAQQGIRPGLSVILVGEDPASQAYVNNKEKDCERVGFYSEFYRLPKDTPMVKLIALIQRLNENASIHGILVQHPMPAHINESEVFEAISPKKDVDCFNMINVGLLATGGKCLLPGTPQAIIWLLKNAGIEIAGKHAVVIGRSNIVGKPMAFLLLRENATVTICHSKTTNLKNFTQQADILVAAIGKSEFVTGDMIKPGAAVIDVGINQNASGMVGDVEFSSVVEVAGYITPVPGGVGPMTRAMMLFNTLEAAKRDG
jgi:methylenetetrahydrofolate dehydrogenase (NADP+) / methenyltetrahydrofolate cyclohydrolase